MSFNLQPDNIYDNPEIVSVSAVKRLWYAVVAPWNIGSLKGRMAMAVVAVAVLLSAFISAAIQSQEAGDPQLRAEYVSYTSAVSGVPSAAAQDDVNITSASREFTLRLGTGILFNVIFVGFIAFVCMVAVRFLTNSPASYWTALTSSAASTSILIIGTIVNGVLHIVTHSMRWGMHAGVFVDPVSTPFIFKFLEQLDVFRVWQYIVACIGITTALGMHRKVGVVVGVVAWFCVYLILVGGLTIISWVMSKSPVT